MSAEELSRLSLGDKMVTTRAGAARARTAPVQANRSQSPSEPQTPPSQAQSYSQSASPTPSLIESASGLTYNVTAFDNKVRRRAKQGLMDNNVIKMKYCRLLDEELNQYMFYLDDEIQVAMGGRYKVPKCTCGANEGGIACKHIFWMLDQLTSGAPANIKSQTLQVPEDGSSVQDMKPGDMIDKMTLGRVADGLGWVLHDGPIPDDEDIEDEIAEILSVFEPSEAIPAEFKSPESPFLSERSRKYREFKDLFTELFTQYATKNLGLFDRLQTVIDPDFQAQVFFEKIHDRIIRAFKALDAYITHGSTAAPSEAYDVVTCAGKLRALVKAIDDYFHQQEEGGHDTKTVAVQAAAALISILDGVVSRNYDAYANITWNFVPPEEPRENNLFVCLIAEPADDDGLFVLETLRALPQEDILRNHWELLYNISERLSPQWTPKPYVDLFRAITTDGRKRAGSDVEGGSSKRTMQ